MSEGIGWGTWALLGAMAFGLYQCSQEPMVVETSDFYVASPAPSPEAVDRAEDAASDAVAGTTYADQGRPYGCTQDCSGHDAGYAWAQENDVTDPDDCGGNSMSFEEGCRAYGEAYQEARDEAIEASGE